MIIGNFKSIRPRYQIPQEASLTWLGKAHSRAEAVKAGDGGGFDEAGFERKVSALLRRHGCSPTRIRCRGSEIPDFAHQDWDRMELFSLTRNPEGPTTDERNACFHKAGQRICREMYSEADSPPEHLIHVTCTSYVSPSCVQELVVDRGWSSCTVVTHAYHMGCYAALPATLMARGFLALPSSRKERRVDIVHTEFCSGHLQPADHSPEQIVVQSLFADGFIRYSVFADDRDPGCHRPGLEMLGQHEIMIPGTRNAITWECGDHGMKMGLSRDVPNLITEYLPSFLAELASRAGVSPDEMLSEAVFAIHPGGPKIIDQIQTLCRLTDDQVSFSRAILLEYGNMSSATLPHVWAAVAADPGVAAGTRVVSLAFGPGLSISGAVLVKTA